MSSIYRPFYVKKSRAGASTTAIPFGTTGAPNGIIFTVAAGNTFNFTTPAGITTALFGFTPGATVLISPDSTLAAPSGSQVPSSAHINPAVRSLQASTEYYGYAVDDTVVSITYYSD